MRFAAAMVLVTCPAAFAQLASSSASAEDFTSISVASSQLHPESPELVEKDVEPNYISEWIKVQWRSDDPIYLYVVRPTHVPKAPVVIYLYDYPAETDIFRESDWCEHVTAGGYAAVGLVPAFNGQRYHGRPMKEWFVSELQEALVKSAHDVQMVLNYLAERGDVDMNSVGIFGVGAGATIAVAAASVDSRIKAIDLVDPWGNWPRWMAKSEVIPEEERSRYIKPDFLKQVSAFDPVSLLPTLTAPRVRLNQSVESSSTPREAGSKIEAALPPGAERRPLVDGAQFDPLVASGGKDFDWLKLQLKFQDSKQPVSKTTRGGVSSDHQSGCLKQ
jgi:cephalosporin-C deacetylase-like acetyl esterase